VEYRIRHIQSQGHNVKVCIGTDSQVHGLDTNFATVILFLKEKHGGLMLVSNDRSRKRLSLKERMLLEVSKSVEVAYELSDLLKRYQVAMEVHADISMNPQCKSYEALREAMGYILGMGYVFKAKPDAFASSCCADKLLN